MHTCKGIQIFIPTGSLFEPPRRDAFACDGYTLDDDRITIYRDGQVVESYSLNHIMGYAVDKAEPSA